MKKYFFVIASIGFLFSQSGFSQTIKQYSAKGTQKKSGKTAAKSSPALKKTPTIKAVVESTAREASQNSAQLNQALRLMQNGQCQQAVPALYSMSRKAEFAREKMQIKYILGSCLMDLGLNQIAAFELVEVIKNGSSRYVKQAIEKLSVAADTLGDDTLLNYAISKIKVDEIPAGGKDLIYFRLGEVKLKSGQYEQAIGLFNKVPDSSRFYFLSRYNKGLAYLEMKKPLEAVQLFRALSAFRSGAGVTDTNRVIAKMALARSYYQAQDWDNSLAVYREIPRDHFLWHDALFESSWAMLRGARFRSALGNVHSLHSSYYENSFIPESLLVRAIVYLYICKYDEMEKVLDLFDHTYVPVNNEVNSFLMRVKDPNVYFQEIDFAYNSKSTKQSSRAKLPALVLNHILREGDVKRGFGYLRALNEEKNRLDQLPSISRTALGARGRKIIGNRYKNAKITIGEMVKNHLYSMRSEMRDLFEQAGFIRYEMINGKKEQLKKRIAGKYIPSQNVDEDVDRSMYVQNGYEYWPFDGEFWLDEIGNYHYLGKQNCE